MIRQLGWSLGFIWLMHSACLAQLAPANPTTGYIYPIQTAPAGKHVWVVGQRPLDKQGNLVGKGNLDTQLRQVFANIKAALASVNCTLSDIRQITYHIRQLDTSKEAIVSDVRNLYLPKQDSLISQIKNVGQVVNDNILVEIEVVAISSR